MEDSETRKAKIDDVRYQGECGEQGRRDCGFGSEVFGTE
jgi:hypothetical protein